MEAVILQPAAIFCTDIVDLGSVDPRFAGILSPAPEVGTEKVGVDARFLEDAETYYENYQGFDYWRALIKHASSRVGISDPRLIIEYGCGFGNSTLPMLELFPAAQVVATDISPNLLSILDRLVVNRDWRPRCLPVAMDAQKPYLKNGIADLVVGSAILHHLINPEVFVGRAMDVLRPGGAAIFFEPFEAGHAMLRQIGLEVGAEAARRNITGVKSVDWLRNLPTMLEAQIFRQAVPNWQNINDKWAFPKSVLERISNDYGARLTVYPLHDNKKPYSRHAKYMMGLAQIKPEDVPDWVWNIFEHYEERMFSPEMLTDMLIEGCIIFQKP